MNFKWAEYFQMIWDLAEGSESTLYAARNTVGVTADAELFEGVTSDVGGAWLARRNSVHYYYPAYNHYLSIPLPTDDAQLRHFARRIYYQGGTYGVTTSTYSEDNFSSWFSIPYIEAAAGDAVSMRFGMSGASYSGLSIPVIQGNFISAIDTTLSQAICAIVPASITDPASVTPADIVYGVYNGQLILKGQTIATGVSQSFQPDLSAIPKFGTYYTPYVAYKGPELNSFFWLPADDYAIVIFATSVDGRTGVVINGGIFLHSAPGGAGTLDRPATVWRDFRGGAEEITE